MNRISDGEFSSSSEILLELIVQMETKYNKTKQNKIKQTREFKRKENRSERFGFSNMQVFSNTNKKYHDRIIRNGEE